MRSEFFADILLILLVCSIIFVILSLTNRSKRGSKESPGTEESQKTEEN